MVRFFLLLLHLFLMVAYEVHVAPMVNYTTRHYRYMMRLLSSDAILWSEMIKPGEVLHASGSRQAELLSRGLEKGDGQCIAQFGGDDALELVQCCRLASAFSYDSVNLNLGCPSVETNAHFGASLMRDPDHVAMLLDAMAEQELPVSVKCRIGIHERYQDVGEDRLETLIDFVRKVTRSGAVKHVTVHARSAVLQGLDPEKNRSVPPLRYDFVDAVAREFPNIDVVLNGGVQAVNASMLGADSPLAGVMVGRAFLRRPLDILHTHAGLASVASDAIADRAMLQYARYAAREIGVASSASAAVDVLLPLILIFQSLHRRDDDEEQPSRGTNTRRLKLVMQVTTPLLRQTSASASVLSSLRAVEAGLDEIADDDEEGIGREADRLNKVLKALLGKKLVGKLRANCGV